MQKGSLVINMKIEHIEGKGWVGISDNLQINTYPTPVAEKLTNGKWSLWQVDNPNDIDHINQKNILFTIGFKIEGIDRSDELYTKEDVVSLVKSLTSTPSYISREAALGIVRRFFQ